MHRAQDADLFAVRYSRVLDIGAVIVVIGWHVAGDGATLLTQRESYLSPAVAAAAWTVQLVVGAVGAWHLFRGRPVTVLAARSLVVINVAAGVAAVAVCPRDHLLQADWSWGAVGWIAVLLLLHRPVHELAVLLAVEAAITFAALEVTGNVTRHNIAGFITVLYASASVQIVMVVATRVLDSTARSAVAAAAEREAIATRQAIAAEIVAARQIRYKEARESIPPLLRGLADKTLDPGDPAVQRRCGIEALKLRRLAAENDDRHNPLLHELQTCIDIAERRGAAIELLVVGSVPELERDVRRALTEVPLMLLATTRAYARVVVTSLSGYVSVSIRTDSTGPVPDHLSEQAVTIIADRDDDLLWAETRWQIR